jgi:isoleucyl-tRNA synthetase
MDDYEPTMAGRGMGDLVEEQLGNWYVRLCRRRFWKGEYEQDKISAYQTLYECLETVCRLTAPISPFFADFVFSNLNQVTGRNKAASVHHAFFPESSEAIIDEQLEERMQLAQDASSLILSIRKKVNIKVRQPLQKVLIPVASQVMKEQLERVGDLIKAEVNVKEIEYLEADNQFIRKKIKPNFVALGKKLGPKMKQVSAALSDFGQQEIRTLETAGQIKLDIDNEPLVILKEEVDIQSEDVPGWMVATKNALTVALDVTLTDDLEQEGNARELVNRIQRIRKDSGFDLTDRILVKLSQHDKLAKAISQYNDYICAEILADKLEFVPTIIGGTDIEVNDIPLQVFIEKKG